MSKITPEQILIELQRLYQAEEERQRRSATYCPGDGNVLLGIGVCLRQVEFMLLDEQQCDIETGPWA